MLTLRDAWRDVHTIAQLVRPTRRRSDHKDQLESFYVRQAQDYDRFRERLLRGRQALIEDLPLRPGAVWIDLGGGTAYNLTHAGARLTTLNRVYVIDLTPSLLDIARCRCRVSGWTNVNIIEGDATAVTLPTGIADVVTCSYSLTMIPDWRLAVSEAFRLLKPGGTFGAVDFHVSPQHPRITRRFWPWWFAHSHVRLDADHLPTLRRWFTTTSVIEDRTALPYVPLGRVPFYRFLGRRPGLTPGS